MPALLVLLCEHDIQDGSITITQNKTGMKLRISIEGELAALLQRITKRKSGYKIRGLALIVDDNGQRITLRTLQGHFFRAREAAGIKQDQFQISGICERKRGRIKLNQAVISGKLKNNLATAQSP